MTTSAATYKIENSNGLSGPAWDADYTTQASAAEAIRRAYRWDLVVLSDSYSVGDDYGTGDASAVSAYQTQQDCDADPDGAHAPRIVEIFRRVGGDPDAQCPTHGCARWRCDADHQTTAGV